MIIHIIEGGLPPLHKDRVSTKSGQLSKHRPTLDEHERKG